LVGLILPGLYASLVQPVTWKINRERAVVYFGWPAAILMQFAHPLVAAGVAQHSQFRAGLATRLDRLRSTVDSMLALVFGTPEQAAAAAEAINRIHDRVNGRVCGAAGAWSLGAGYSAHDPALLRWVYATLLDVLPRAYELYVGPLTDAEKERYCREASAIAPLLGISDGYLPSSRAELTAYLDWAVSSGQVAVGDTARELADALLHPAPRGVDALLCPLRLAAAGFLPPDFRRAYGLAWGPRHDRAWRLSAGLVRRGLALVPPALRYWPLARRACCSTA
jgi:uncharacterized protein (DUF2236 family)